MWDALGVADAHLIGIWFLVLLAGLCTVIPRDAHDATLGSTDASEIPPCLSSWRDALSLVFALRQSFLALAPVGLVRYLIAVTLSLTGLSVKADDVLTFALALPTVVAEFEAEGAAHEAAILDLHVGWKLRIAALSVLGDEAGAAEDAAGRSHQLASGTTVLSEDLCCLSLHEERETVLESISN